MMHLSILNGPPLALELTQLENAPFFLNVYDEGVVDPLSCESAKTLREKLFNHFDPDTLKSKVMENGLDFKLIDNGFKVTLPYDNCTSDDPLIHDRFCSAINVSLKRFFNPIAENFDPPEIQTIESREPVSFYRDNVVFNVLGTICFLVCFSMNEALSGHLLQRSLITGGTQSEIQELTVDSISEICNTIVGNAFSAFERFSEILRLGTPIVFHMDPEERLSANRPVTFSHLRLGPYQMKVFVMKL